MILTPFDDRYRQNVVASFRADAAAYPNVLSVPRIERIVLNVGLNQGRLKEPKYMETVEKTLTRISGQKPVKTLARKSIASFKVRQGSIIGMMVTLRGRRMKDFFDRMIFVTLPRARDFWGLDPASIDKQGNLSIGFKEHLVFPEIRSDEVECIHGLEVVIGTSAHNPEEGKRLLEALGVPFKKKE